MVRETKFALGALALAVLLAAGLFTLTRGEEKAASPAMLRDALYGNYWQPATGRILIDLDDAFRQELAFRHRKRGGTLPFFNSASPQAALRSWKAAWLGVQLDILSEKGWEYQGSLGGFAVLRDMTAVKERQGWPELCRLLGLDARILKAAPQFLERGETPFEVGGGFTFPYPSPEDLNAPGPRYGYYGGGATGIMVPPAACALRIYAPAPLSAERVKFAYFPLRFVLLKEGLLEVRRDDNACNVLTFVFDRSDGAADRFWRWMPFSAFIQAGKGVESKDFWVAWEFLDSDMEPLPDDSTLPVRFFPRGFEAKFRPIPLAEVVKK